MPSAFLALILLVILLFTSCRNENDSRHYSEEGNQNMNDTLIQIISPNQQVLSRQATVKLTAQNETQPIKAQGYIDFDRTRDQSVSTRFGGRIEKLYIKYNLQFVKKGEKILELYSPELNTIQEEHVFLLKTEAEKTLLEQSRLKLKLLGITDKQIIDLEKKGTFTKTILIYSPVTGFVFFDKEIKNNPDPPASEQTLMNNMDMNSKNNSAETFGSSNIQVREGMYVNKGETLFRVNDLQYVWAIVSVSSEFNSSFNESSPVKIISELFPDEQLKGNILLIEQTYEENKQPFIRIRIALSNTNRQLKLNSFVTAEIIPGKKGIFQIPVSAVYRTGLNSFVWVKTGTTQAGTGIFRLRKVITTTPANGMATVMNGLTENEEVAEHAGYLTDSETFLNDK